MKCCIPNSANDVRSSRDFSVHFFESAETMQEYSMNFAAIILKGHPPTLSWDFIIFDDVVIFSSFWLPPRVASAFGLPGFDAAGRLVPGSAGSDICVSLAIVEFARQKWHTRVSAPLTHTSSSLFIYGCKGIWADCGGIAAKLNIAFLDDPDDMSRASCEVLHSEFCERRTK